LLGLPDEERGTPAVALLVVDLTSPVVPAGVDLPTGVGSGEVGKEDVSFHGRGRVPA